MARDGTRMYFVSITRVLRDFKHMTALYESVLENFWRTDGEQGRLGRGGRRTPQSYADCEGSKEKVSVVTIIGTALSRTVSVGYLHRNLYQ